MCSSCSDEHANIKNTFRNRLQLQTVVSPARPPHVNISTPNTSFHGGGSQLKSSNQFEVHEQWMFCCTAENQHPCFSSLISPFLFSSLYIVLPNVAGSPFLLPSVCVVPVVFVERRLLLSSEEQHETVLDRNIAAPLKAAANASLPRSYYLRTTDCCPLAPPAGVALLVKLTS